MAIPKAIAITTYDAYEEHNGVMATATVEMTKQMLFNKRESTQGKSAKYPQAIRPTVLVIPMMERRNDAWLGSTSC